MNQFSYFTIDENGYAEFKDRGSKFLAYAYPIKNRDEIKAPLLELRKLHPKAVHFCYAYRIGVDGLDFRANDDGEPSGSAGKPILNQIDSTGITNVLVVVVRYFGGTLLGVPGLINAYKTATQLVLQDLPKVEKIIEKALSLSFDYNHLGDVMNQVKYHQASIVRQEMALFCEVTISIPLSHYDTFYNKMNEMYGVTII